ncbi:MAG TPA: asparagine synthetase B [Candidatus Kapabacteria bacterium]|nr:asparagine synthetase B [Candidatus Kapabacteria bacterium]
MKRIIIILAILISSINGAYSEKILIPMDLAQSDHLKAYGIVYWTLKLPQNVDWLLNYRGGSFLTEYREEIIAELRIRGVSFEVLSDGDADGILTMIKGENVNMDDVLLEKAPKIAVYVAPGNKPWDDAVRLVLEYAEIPYDMVWDEEVLRGDLKKYDWLHLHHEDFTGQYGKFWANYQNQPWYIQQVTLNENMAGKLGFAKVSEMKKAVVLKMKEFIANGGYMFGMCSATDTWDIALSALNVDICPEMFDGDPADPQANSKLDFSQSLVFENFHLILDPYIYEYSDIDVNPSEINLNPESDYFTLFDFSAKFDPLPTILTQDHANIIHGFMGQTTAFHQRFIKKNVIILGQKEGTDEVKYLMTNFGKGFLSWYGGHDPEDYQHFVGDPPTDLALYKNSPGYRLILNNVLFPAAKKKVLKT